MSSYLHPEEHFRASDRVRDVVIGMADGLTVPFALAAGISSAAASVDLVVTAGVAEVAAGSIAMGLGGYLAGRSARDHYLSEQRREEEEIRDLPEVEAEEIGEIFQTYGLKPAEYKPLVEGLKRDPVAWRDFMMRFELGLEEPDPGEARRSAATIAVSYVAGGMIPLAPYMLMHDGNAALRASSLITLAALLVFGFVKGHFTGVNRWVSALQTMGIGAVAAAAAFGIARLIG